MSGGRSGAPREERTLELIEVEGGEAAVMKLGGIELGRLEVTEDAGTDETFLTVKFSTEAGRRLFVHAMAIARGGVD